MPVSEHLSKKFDAELESIRSRVLEMGGLVESQIRRALEGLQSGDRALLDDVIATDHRVNGMEVALDGECSHVIVKRQPAANDLRLIFAITKTVTDLERIGDEAVNISERAKEGHAAKDEVKDRLEKMSEQAQQMVRDALDAFVEGEAARAEQVLERDDDVDAAYGDILRKMTEFMKNNVDEIPAAIRVMKVAKYIERIADHATNIAEEVIFMVRGEDVRHVRTHPPPKVQH